MDRIVAELRAEGGTPAAERVGELALRGLRELDRVAYVRFASVYRKFEDVAQFEAELASGSRSSRRCSASTCSSGGEPQMTGSVRGSKSSCGVTP